MSNHKLEQDDTEGKDIILHTAIFNALVNLRRHVVTGPDSGLKKARTLISFDRLCKAKIDDLDVARVINHNISCFEVSMSKSFCVHV